MIGIVIAFAIGLVIGVYRVEIVSFLKSLKK